MLAVTYDGKISTTMKTINVTQLLLINSRHYGTDSKHAVPLNMAPAPIAPNRIHLQVAMLVATKSVKYEHEYYTQGRNDEGYIGI